MKKIIKIFASVLAMSVAMSTVIMPISAEAAATTMDYTFTTAADVSAIGATQADGLAGKHTTDKVAKIPSSTTRNFGDTFSTSTGYATYEVDIYIPSPSSSRAVMQVYNNGGSGNVRANFDINNGTIKYNAVSNGGDIWASKTSTAQLNANWNKFAITWDYNGSKFIFYVNGVKIDEIAVTGMVADTAPGEFAFSNGSGDVYIDNMRITDAAYDATCDIMPAEDNDTYTFLADSMTVAEAKAMLMANQNAETAVARVYKGAVGGNEAEDTELIQGGWNVVVTSLSGDFYHSNNVHTVVKSVEVTATLADGTLTATVTKLTDNVIPSMIMVLVQNNGQVVKASDAVTNVGLGTTTFTISDVGTSLVNPQIFFINTWDELAPALDEITSVTQ